MFKGTPAEKKALIAGVVAKRGRKDGHLPSSPKTRART
jgi:hypothetical protein